MILPIVAYGAAILRKVSEPIDADYPNLTKVIADMWETMYESNGVGLAAPQVNKNIRLFVMDSAQIFESKEPEDEAYVDAPGFKKVFINAQIVSTGGVEWIYNEGCLSIPKIREDVLRPAEVTLSYMDENFVVHTETFNGISARVILHEYDHIQGKLFIDYLKPLRRKILQGKLNDISKGKVRVDYKMTQIK
ncbi:MAG: peptide deformylase [Chitinophagia bacterium]|jgi:peptide deformylase|nr:peptide deformylase [Chitinophagia bacterium]